MAAKVTTEKEEPKIQAAPEPDVVAKEEPKATAAPTPVVVPGVTAEEGAQMRRALRELARITGRLLELQYRGARPMYPDEASELREKAAVVQELFS